MKYAKPLWVKRIDWTDRRCSPYRTCRLMAMQLLNNRSLSNIGHFDRRRSCSAADASNSYRPLCWSVYLYPANWDSQLLSPVLSCPIFGLFVTSGYRPSRRWVQLSFGNRLVPSEPPHHHWYIARSLLLLPCTSYNTESSFLSPKVSVNCAKFIQESRNHFTAASFCTRKND